MSKLLWDCKDNGLRKKWSPQDFRTGCTYVIPDTDNIYDSIPNLIKLLNDKHLYLNDTQLPGRIIYTYNQENQGGIELPTGAYSHVLDQYSNSYLEERSLKSREAYVPLINLDKVLADIKLFKSSKDIYEEMQVGYRRGYLLHGPPGNGKTASIRNMLDSEAFKDAQVIWCRSLPNDAFLERLSETPNLKIFIMEELTDQHGRSNYDMARLLEFLDGENSVTNSVVIATTNYPEMLAENLANRPSRFDMVIKIDNPDAVAINTLFSLFLGREIAFNEVSIKDVSIAHIKEIVLVHKMHNIGLQEAADYIKNQRDNFKNNFQEKKPFGL